MKAYVLVKVTPGKVRDVTGDLVKKQRAGARILSVDAITGPYDVVAVVEGPDLNAIGTLVTEFIGTTAGVQSTLTCLVVFSR
jgi:DNA-binding Lrp family transcriptional regulator